MLSAQIEPHLRSKKGPDDLFKWQPVALAVFLSFLFSRINKLFDIKSGGTLLFFHLIDG